MTHDLRAKPPTTALEIAVLVKAIPLEAGAKLIQQYADTAAAGARLEATERMDNKITGMIEGPMQTVVFP